MRFCSALLGFHLILPTLFWFSEARTPVRAPPVLLRAEECVLWVICAFWQGSAWPIGQTNLPVLLSKAITYIGQAQEGCHRFPWEPEYECLWMISVHKDYQPPSFLLNVWSSRTGLQRPPTKPSFTPLHVTPNKHAGIPGCNGKDSCKSSGNGSR